MSVNFTIRIPKELVAKMRKYRGINWSKVIRKSIEKYLMELEEAKSVETPYEVLERLKEPGVKEEDIAEYSEAVEGKFYEEMVGEERQRNYTIQAR